MLEALLGLFSTVNLVSNQAPLKLILDPVVDMARILHRFMRLLSINDCVHVYEAVWLCSNGYYIRMSSCILVTRVVDW